MSSSKPPPKRAKITPAQKKALCEHAEQHPQLMHEQLAQWFNKTYNPDKPTVRATVGKILAAKAKWLAVDVADGTSHKAKQRPPKWPQLDQALLIFVAEVSGSLVLAL